MKKTKQTIDESLNKMKYMMNYDSSKTRFENEGTVIMEQVAPGEMFAKTAKGATMAAGAGWLAGPAIAGALPTGTMAGSVIGGLTAGAAATLGAAVFGAAAIGLIPLILWLNDKDKVRPKVEKLFKYVEDNKEKIDQIPRGLSDEDIWNASDTLFSAMKRLGTREKDVYKVFNSLQTISDLSALISFYNGDNVIDLLKQLDRDFDQTREWMQIYRPVRNLVLRFKEQMEEEGKILQQQQQQQQKDKDPGAEPRPNPVPAAGSYRFANGTSDDPFKYGTQGSGISQVQQNAGLVVDGKWGPKTQAKMAEFAPEYVNGFTNADILKVIQKFRPSNSGVQKPTIQRPSVGPQVDKLTLQPLAPNNMTAADAKKQWRELRKQERQAR
jgi:peptidoglycan hydrolase-like protein with peptidoglycan-binding domain